MNESEPSDHLQLRTLLQNAKPILVSMFPDQKKKWVAESPRAQEISAILVKHPEYYDEFRALVGGIFPEPKRASR